MKKIDLEKVLVMGAEIQVLVDDLKIDWIDACVLYCERNSLEVEYVGEIIKKNQNIKAELQKEAEKLNFLKKQNRL
jgi:hypothetical protein